MTKRPLISLLALLLIVSGPASARTPKKHSHGKHHAHVKKAGAWKKHGQHEIDPDRTREIQQALVRAHYLNGAADGNWNAETKAAMAKYQKDNGWQSKRVPDSRALIKLGLGPNHEAIPATELAGATNSTAAASVSVPQR